MSEYLQDRQYPEQDGARPVVYGVGATLAVGAIIFTGVNVLSSGPEPAQAQQVQEASPPIHRKALIVHIGNQTLKCTLSPEKYKILTGDNAWDIVDAHTTTYPDASDQQGRNLFIYAWQETVGRNQQKGNIGANPNLIYTGDELELFEHCTLTADTANNN